MMSAAVRWVMISSAEGVTGMERGVEEGHRDNDRRVETGPLGPPPHSFRAPYGDGSRFTASSRTGVVS
jgi:hypothetical protein